MSTLLTLEGSGGAEPDQSQLESMVESQQQFQMRFAVADENGGSQTGDPYGKCNLWIFKSESLYFRLKPYCFVYGVCKFHISDLKHFIFKPNNTT